MRPLRRLLSALATLAIVTFATFVGFERGAGRADARAVDQRVTRAEREQTRRILDERSGRIDPETGERRGFVERYLRWAGRVVSLDLVPRGEDPRSFRRRWFHSVGVSAGLGIAAMLLALSLGAPLGYALGSRAGRLADRIVSPLLLMVGALPQFLTATLVLFGMSIVLGVDWRLIPAVLTLAVLPFVGVVRFVRERTAELQNAPFIDAQRLLGVEEPVVAASLKRHALGPVRTKLGTWLPGLLAGSIVVEDVFELPGLGRLMLLAIQEQELEIVMATTTLIAWFVLLGLWLSETWQRSADPRQTEVAR